MNQNVLVVVELSPTHREPSLWPCSWRTVHTNEQIGISSNFVGGVACKVGVNF
jgi:hypothetical protein